MKRKSTSNLHPNTVKLPKNNTSFEKKIFLEEKPCFSKTMFVCKEKHVFLTKNDQHIVFSGKRLSNHPSWDRLFNVYVNEIDGWGAHSHARQLDQFFPWHKFEIWEGTSH